VEQARALPLAAHAAYCADLFAKITVLEAANAADIARADKEEEEDKEIKEA